MDRSRPTLPFTIVAILALVLAACTQASPEATDAAEETEAEATEADGGGATGETVTISGSTFGDDITVAAGTTVTFVNEDSLGHTVTEGSDGQAVDEPRFDEDVAAGESVEVTFDEPGTYQVTCEIHPTMNMTVTVEG
jgi:plastocyanin